MTTNDLVNVLQTVSGSPDVQDAFNRGLLLGGIIVAACIVFSMLRHIGGHREEL